MKIVPVDDKTLYRCIRKEKANIDKLIDDFRDSKAECAEVKDFPHKTAISCRGSITSYLKRNKIYTVYATVRDNRVFLVKKKI